MEDDDVLLENDPLAIYLMHENIDAFETVKLTADKPTNFIKTSKDFNALRSYEEFQSCFESILQCELLLEEDYNMLEIYYSNNPFTYSRRHFHNILLSSLTVSGVALFKYSSFKTLKVFSVFCAVPLALNVWKSIKKRIKNRRITLLLSEMTTFSNVAKKCLRIVGEFSATIGYYSSATINISSINSAYTNFAKEFYSFLISMIKLLAQHSSEVSSLVPLTIENNLKYGLKEDLFAKENVNVSDLKLLYELYLLVQSDFIKTLGLSFCSYLWPAPNCDVDKLLDKIVPSVFFSVKEKTKRLESECLFLRNFGANKNTSLRTPKKYKNVPLTYMSSCVHNTEMHFQQLLCKTRDLQSFIEKTDLSKEEEQSPVILSLLTEMEKQVDSAKNMLDAIIKYYNQLHNKHDFVIKPPVQQPPVNSSFKTLESQDEELAKTDKLIYELYIPKEGLDLTELAVDSERPVFSMKDVGYSGVLLEELKTILRARNPEMFLEETTKPEINSDSEDEEEFYGSRRRRDIFRPTQPIGLAENLQSINHVLAARRNMLQCEELCDDTFSGSDTNDDCVTEN